MGDCHVEGTADMPPEGVDIPELVAVVAIRLAGFGWRVGCVESDGYMGSLVNADSRSSVDSCHGLSEAGVAGGDWSVAPHARLATSAGADIVGALSNAAIRVSVNYEFQN